MWYPAVDTDAPSAEPVTLTEVKRHVRAEYHTDDDSYLSGLISSARDHVERYTGTFLAPRTVSLKCDWFADFSHVPLAPVQDVSITYVDTSGATQTLPSSVYELRNDGLQTAFVLKRSQSWPAIEAGSRITVEADVGYEKVPPALRHALLIWIGSAYEVREDAPAGGRSTFDDLLSNFRR